LTLLRRAGDLRSTSTSRVTRIRIFGKDLRQLYTKGLDSLAACLTDILRLSVDGGFSFAKLSQTHFLRRERVVIALAACAGFVRRG
jgi:hypothetical protein